MADNVIVRVPEQQFIRGEDGYSPEVTIENINHGHSITITDREHQEEGQTFNVLDGDSAYEQAVAGGYTGTEAQFNEELASFKELSDETKEAAPFYAEYGVTTKAEIQAAINGKRQIYLHHGSLGGIVAPYTGTFLYADIWGEGTGYRFALTNGNFQYVYELKSEWTYSIYDLTAPAQRAETAAAQALTRMNSADASAQAAAGSAGDASTAATTATTKAGEASDSATAADGSAKDSEAYAIGKRGGTDVGSSDPAYHNNAKYYAQQASGSATAASGSATAAASSATAAGNAQAAAETAQGAAEDAQEAAEAVLASIPEDYTELSGDVDDLKSAVNTKAPAIYDTASGAIASFEDGADGMPLKQVVVDIEPVQNLNGYDKPWPAGGGKNLLKYPYYYTTLTSNGITFTDNGDGSITVNGTATANADFYFFHSTASLPLSNGSYIFSSSYTGQIPDNGFYIHAKANAEDASYLNIGIGAEGSYTVSNGVFYVACIRVSSGKTLDNVRVYPMLRLASEADATFEPYSNICPITGWTGCNVIRIGKNLWPIATIGQETTTNIPLNIPAGDYIMSYDVSRTGLAAVVRFFYVQGDSSQSVVKKAQQRAVHFDKPVASANFSISNFESGDSVTNIQLELGSTASAYEPYQWNTYSITFPASAGTVYGGTLTINADGSGELMTTQAIAILNGSEPGWQMQATYKYGFFLDNAMPGLGRPTSINSNQFKCNKYTIANAIQNSSQLPNVADNAIFNQNNVSTWLTRLWIKDTAHTGDLAGFKTSLAENNLQIVYPLAEPITYQLTAQQITTLLGTNNIWADCGPVSVNYPADTKLYIQKINAPTDDDMIADTQIASGKYFLIGNTLYLSTTVIPAGDAIIPGTNCQQTNLAAALNALNA